MRKVWLTGVMIASVALTGCNYLGPCIDGAGPVAAEFRDRGTFTGIHNTGSFDIYVSRADTFSIEVRAQQNLIPYIETYVSGYTLIVQTQNDVCYRSSSPVEVHITMPETEVLRLTGSGKVFADIAASPEVEISNSGSGYMEIDSVGADSYKLSNSGSGHISIEGSFVNEVDVVQSGSGALFCGTLWGATRVKMRHSSSGLISALLTEATALDVVLSGSGTIEVAGDVGVAEYSLSSSGKMDALDLMASEVNAINTGSGNIYTWATDLLDATITGSGSIIYRGNPLITTRITGSGSVRSY